MSTLASRGCRTLHPAVLAVCLLACSPASTPHAAAPTNGAAAYFDQFNRAQDLAKHEKYSEAISLYEPLTRSFPDDVEVWAALANARARAKQFRPAAEAFSQAIARGAEYPSILAYRTARLYAMAGDQAQAFTWLEKSLAMPLENRPRIAEDEAFTAYRGDPKFRALAGLAPGSSLSRDASWNADLDFLVSEIRRLHYAYRTNPLPRGFDDDVRSLRQRLPKLTDAAMEPEIQRLLARLGDGHTGLQGMPPPHIPLVFYDFSDGVFVTDAPDVCACIGQRVLAVGDTPIQAAIQKLTPFLSIDNAMGVRLKAPIYLRFPIYLRAAGIAPSLDEVAVTFEGPHGRHSYTAKPTGGPGTSGRLFPSRLAGAPPVPRYLQRTDENYWFEISPDGSAAFLQFNQVSERPGNTFEQFAGTLLKALAPSKIRNLIIDVRLNGGGNLDLFPPLLRAIITFQTTHEGAGIYLLTSRQTFSAAQVFVNDLDHYTSAVVAGEPSGSRPNFIGESAPTTLPHSGLYMTISTRYHQTDDQDQRTWIAPKIPVELTSADYFANRDPVLEAVQAVIAARPRQ